MTAERPDTLTAIEALDLRTDRPLIVCDADEVLVRFAAGLERYLATEDLWLDLRSFALTGNIKQRSTGRALDQGEVSALLKRFYASETERLEPVAGAAAALEVLAERCRVVVLSNVPEIAREARRRWLAAHGMPYPVVANRGLKGAALQQMAARSGRPAVFFDDLPHNIADAARCLPEGVLVHFVADERLARLLPAAPECHLRTGDWDEALAFVLARLSP